MIHLDWSCINHRIPRIELQGGKSLISFFLLCPICGYPHPSIDRDASIERQPCALAGVNLRPLTPPQGHGGIGHCVDKSGML